MAIAEFLGAAVVVLLVCILISFILRKLSYQSRESYWIAGIITGLMMSVGKLKGRVYDVFSNQFGNTEAGRLLAVEASSYLGMSAEIIRTVSIELIVPYVISAAIFLIAYYLNNKLSRNGSNKIYFEAGILYIATTLLIWGISSFSGLLAAVIIGFIFVIVSLIYFYKNKSNYTENILQKFGEHDVVFAAPQVGTTNSVNSPITMPPPASAPASNFNQSAPPIQPIQANFAVGNASDDIWAQALTEYDSGSRNQGLWARLFSEAQGNEALIKANYLRVRVDEMQQLITAENERAAADLESEQLEIRRIAEAARQAELQLAMTVEQREYDALPKGLCPNCKGAVLPLTVSTCPKCWTLLGSESPRKATIKTLSRSEQITALRRIASGGSKLTEYEAQLLERG